ncbi:hypothetical protein [Pandoraea communis]|uniref:hypothetical protein n=1 Tax=Pandoraea communis TaxID=2508297 RepID=UPI0025A5FF4A|nr:hypothetical protein [Pandoraea communis]MDM8357387.1 hypothetical protein [Pandoraea communis]
MASETADVALLVPATMFGWATMGIAVLIHEGATVLVVLNALRLLRFVYAGIGQAAPTGAR